MADPFVTIENLEKSYEPGTKAVDGVTLSVAKGECLVLLGPSGCGKTTTLRCVAGFETAEAGRITIGGVTVFDGAQNITVPPSRRGIGMVFQSFAIWPHMTVIENVAYPLRVRRVAGREALERARAALEVVGLAGFERRGGSELSGGQMQRVSLARSLVYEPDLLLLDEPLSSLDTSLCERLRFEIKQILEKTGTTAIYVTHDQSEAVVLGNVIAVMEGGKVSQLGTGHDIFQRPANEFVARFTGAVNRVLGRVREHAAGGGCTVELSDGTLVKVATSPSAASTALTAGDECVVVVRPESLSLDANEVLDGRNAIPGRVEAVHFLGTHTSYDVLAAGTRINVNIYGSFAEHEMGAPVFVVFDAMNATAIAMDDTRSAPDT